MTRLSVITPLHAPGNRFIEETHRSLEAQSLSDFEWLILENAGGKVPESVKADPRVRVLTLPDENPRGIGALKKILTEASTTPFSVELDADDVLHPSALEKVSKAFEEEADFVYSDFAEFRDMGSSGWLARWPGYPYGEAFGWKSYGVFFHDQELVAMRAPEVNEHNVRLVDWSPNHVRAWRKTSYDKAGGHDPTLAVADDHDLIVRMVLQGAKFSHIPECLYFYRVHGGNTVATKNAAIREGTMAVYNAQIWNLGEHFAAQQKLRKVDLCGGHDAPEGYVILDRHVPEGRAGIVCDLDRRWPLPDGSVGVLRAHDAIEHLEDPVHTFNEAHRILCHGGFFMISVPSTNGLGAFCDPTHKSFWNNLSFRYYTESHFARYVPEFKGRFQLLRLIEWFPSDWHRQENVPYVEAHLVALKPGGKRIMGACLWPE